MKVVYFKLLFTVFFCISFYSLDSQSSTFYRVYGTQKNTNRLLQKDSDLNFKLDSIERVINSIADIQTSFDGSIQLIFHVVYDDYNERITVSEIENQIDSINNAFLNEYHVPKNYYKYTRLNQYDALGENSNIIFCLADENDLSGIDAVNYRQTTNNEWPLNDWVKFYNKGGLDVYEPDSYVNIWICELSDFAGYAQIPGGPNDTDGIVIHPMFFDSGKDEATDYYFQGKTLVHLIASYLGLKELWSESYRCADDFVSDTPIHNAPNYELGSLHGNLSTCNQELEMTFNYMDNTPDSIQYMFTSGQIERLNKFLSNGGPRHGLTQNSYNCLSKVASRSRDYEILGESILVFPNPANTQFTLVYEGITEIEHILIYGVNGNVVFEYSNIKLLPNEPLTIDASAWINGLYFINAKVKNSGTLAERLLISPK